MARPSTYRRTPTPGGLEAVDEGTLAPFDLEMYANLNTGVLEEYMDAEARRSVATAPHVPLRLVVVAIVVGVVFAIVNVVVAMRVGLLVAGAWYATILYALSRRAHPAATSLAAGAGSVAAVAAAGVGLVLPAAFLLAAAPGVPLVAAADLPSWVTVAALTFAASLAGVLLASALRRAWVVEDPFPFPGATGLLQVLEMTDKPTQAAAARSRQTLRLGLAGGVFGALWAVVRDLRPLSGGRALLDAVLGRFHAAGMVGQPVAGAHFTWITFGLSPLMGAIGWFLRFPASIVVLGGSAVVWLAAVPAAVLFDVPTTAPGFDGVLGLEGWWELGQPSALLAFRGPVRVVAAGALVGAAVTTLVRESRAGGRALGLALRRARGAAASLEGGLGWYDWPRRAALVVVAVALAGVVVLVATPDVTALLPAAAVGVAVLLVLAVAAGGALGATGAAPVAGGAAVVVAATALAGFLAGASTSSVAVGAVLAATAFVVTATTLAASVVAHKTALYVGGRPYTLGRVQAVMLPVVAATVAAAGVLLARAAASPSLVPGADLLALPHAHGLTALVALLADGTGTSLFLLGVVFGIVAELVTDHGVLFAVGMFLPLGLAAAVAVGGGLRFWWETAVLDRRARALHWSREKRMVKLLDTYLVMVGVIAGEALVGFLLLVAV